MIPQARRKRQGSWLASDFGGPSSSGSRPSGRLGGRRKTPIVQRGPDTIEALAGRCPRSSARPSVTTKPSTHVWPSASELDKPAGRVATTRLVVVAGCLNDSGRANRAWVHAACKPTDHPVGRCGMVATYAELQLGIRVCPEPDPNLVRYSDFNSQAPTLPFLHTCACALPWPTACMHWLPSSAAPRRAHTSYGELPAVSTRAEALLPSSTASCDVAARIPVAEKRHLRCSPAQLHANPGISPASVLRVQTTARPPNHAFLQRPVQNSICGCRSVASKRLRRVTQVAFGGVASTRTFETMITGATEVARQLDETPLSCVRKMAAKATRSHRAGKTYPRRRTGSGEV